MVDTPTNKALLLAKMCIEYHSNGNAAGEYDPGTEHWKSVFPMSSNWPEEDIRRLAFEVQQEQEMKDWNL